LNPVPKTCSEGWGNSYLVEWYSYAFRVERVTGSNGKILPRTEPIKGSDIARKSTTKILQGDWPWHGNRFITDPRSEWHNVRGRRAEAILFGDMHVAFFRFPDDLASHMNDLPDPNYLFW